MARYLLASDDARTRIGIGGTLERAGHQVDRVTHLRLAAEHADLSRTDAVVVGLERSERCAEFVRTLRARYRALPIVVLLDALSEWQTRRLAELGATRVLVRPLAVDQLVADLEEVSVAGGTGPHTGHTDPGPLLRLPMDKRQGTHARA